MAIPAHKLPRIDEGLQIASTEYFSRDSDGLGIPPQQKSLGFSQESYSQITDHSPGRLPGRSTTYPQSLLTKEEQQAILSDTFGYPKNTTNLPRRRRCGGLAPETVLLIVLVLALIAGIAALGAVLGSKANSKHCTPSPTVTVCPAASSSVPLSSSSSSSPSATPTSDASICENGSVYESATQSTYSRICDSDIKVDATTGAEGAVWKLNPIHSFEQCMDACATWSLEAPKVKSKWKCIAVSWAFDGSKANTCWLKNRTDDHGHAASGMHSAMLKEL